MNDSCQMEKPGGQASSVMKGGINFELKADGIIIRAPVNSPKHLINIFEIIPSER